MSDESSERRALATSAGRIAAHVSPAWGTDHEIKARIQRAAILHLNTDLLDGVDHDRTILETALSSYLYTREQMLTDDSERALAAETRENDEPLRKREVEARAQGKSPRPGPPPPQPYGVSHYGAEMYVAHWLQHRGILDAAKTKSARDDGIDVESSRFIVQVKHLEGNVAVQDVRQLQGVASADGRDPVFFASAGYTADAVKFADLVKMPLFGFDAERATVSPLNSAAEVWLRTEN